MSGLIEQELQSATDGGDGVRAKFADALGEFDLVDACVGKTGGADFERDVAGAPAWMRFEVIRQTTVVAIRLRLKTSLWTLRKDGVRRALNSRETRSLANKLRPAGFRSPAVLDGGTELSFYVLGRGGFGWIWMIGVSVVELLKDPLLSPVAEIVFEGEREEAAAAEPHVAGALVSFAE